MVSSGGLSGLAGLAGAVSARGLGGAVSTRGSSAGTGLAATVAGAGLAVTAAAGRDPDDFAADDAARTVADRDGLAGADGEGGEGGDDAIWACGCAGGSAAGLVGVSCGIDTGAGDDGVGAAAIDFGSGGATRLGGAGVARAARLWTPRTVISSELSGRVFPAADQRQTVSATNTIPALTRITRYRDLARLLDTASSSSPTRNLFGVMAPFTTVNTLYSLPRVRLTDIS